MNLAVPESQRDSIIQPRVGESTSLPWDTRFIFPQPQRGCITSTPERCNPVGVENIFIRSPRVVALLQPWAEIRYPVGVINGA
jgi:hypothetical protein